MCGSTACVITRRRDSASREIARARSPRACSRAVGGVTAPPSSSASYPIRVCGQRPPPRRGVAGGSRSAVASLTASAVAAPSSWTPAVAAGRPRHVSSNERSAAALRGTTSAMPASAARPRASRSSSAARSRACLRSRPPPQRRSGRRLVVVGLSCRASASVASRPTSRAASRSHTLPQLEVERFDFEASNSDGGTRSGSDASQPARRRSTAAACWSPSSK